MNLHIRATVLPERRDRDVFVVDGVIAEDAGGADVTTVLEGAYLLPGLVDAHAHLPFAGPAPDGSWEDKARANARAHLDAGVLAVRDPGGPTPPGIGPAEGLPRTFTAGRFLAVPGGMFPEHGQIELPEERIPEAAEEQFRASGGWVKLIGDFPVPGGGILSRFRPETLAEVSRRVHALGGRVTIHAFLPDTIGAAVDAGFDAIEHGVMLRADQAAEMARKGTALVPTLSGLENWPEILGMFGAPAEEVERAAEALRRHPATVRTAWESGVQVYAGTDAGLVDHGLVRREVRALRDAGMPAEDALGAASWRARTFLGLPGMEAGAPADLVAFEHDPLEDPAALEEPVLIVLDGRVVRSPRTVTR
ncbi:MAG: amidohydrolase family protein [Actinomycetota bacterium]